MSKLKRIESILLFLTLLFLPTQLGKHFWPDFSFIYSLKIDYLSPTLYFWDILAAGLLIAWALQKPRINKLAINLLLFFLFTQVLSLLGSFNVGAGLVRLEQFTIAGFFGVYLASYHLRSYVAKLTNILLWPLMAGVLFEGALAVVQFLKGGTLGLWIFGERSFTLSTPGIAKFDFYGYEFLRPYATFPHPNVLAGFMLLAIVILSATKDLSRTRELKQVQRFFTTFRMTIFDVSVVLGGVTIFLTMSRTAILAGLILAAFLVRRKWLMFMGVLLLILSPILFTRYSSLLSFDNLTLLRREELAGSAWQMFVKSPVFGIGLNNFIPAMASQLVTGPSRFLQPVHNIFLLALSETGLIGLIGLISLIGYPIKKIFNFQFSIFKLTPWLIILFLGMFDHYFLTLPQGYRVFFLVWGLSFSVLK